MPIFICRWPNGNFSVVSAPNREYAVELLDQVGNADHAELFSVKDFMVTFQLKQRVTRPDDVLPVELQGFGEQALDVLSRRVYPVYDRAVSEVAEHRPEEEAALQILNDALITERNRLHVAKMLPTSDDPDAAKLQELDLPKSVAQQLVRESSQ